MTDYFVRAIVTAALIGATTGLIGVPIVLRRRVFFAQALTHGTFPGAVVAAALGVSVPLGAAATALLLLAALLALGRTRGTTPSATTGILLAAGFASGVVLQALFPGSTGNVVSYLIGSILTVTPNDTALAGTVLVVSILGLALAAPRLWFATADPAGYRAAGRSLWPLDTLVLVLTTAAVVVGLPAGGAILTIALLAAPAATARTLRFGWLGMFLCAPLIGAGCGVLGVFTSRWTNLSAGPATVLLATLVLLMALGLARVKRLPWERPRTETTS